MLRSIFSLIQNIIDSDKEYNNKKSDTIIYLVSNPDNSLNVDMEIDGKERRNIKTVKEIDKEDTTGSFTITTDQGDTVTCKHYTDKQIRAKVPTKGDEKLQKEYTSKVESDRTTFYNQEEDKCVEDDASCTLKKTKEPHGDHGAHGSTTMDEFMQKLYEKQTRFFERGNFLSCFLTKSKNAFASANVSDFYLTIFRL